MLEKCECGDSCEMKDGEEGICHKGGWCKPATMEPDCGAEGKLLCIIAIRLNILIFMNFSFIKIFFENVRKM